MRTCLTHAAIGLGVVATTAFTLTACASSKSSDSGSKFTTATSAQAGGGMSALVAAAKKEGTLNTIALPPDWANYKGLIAGFKQKYGIKVRDANPGGSSADELTAIKSLKNQDRAPDVVDVGQSFAAQGKSEKLYAPYKVATWDDIPSTLKDPGGLWTNDYGGYISIGCDTSKVTTCPTSIKALNNPAYKGKVGMNGNPTQANAAFNVVWAAALANGGSFDNIQPGIDFFAKLKSQRIYVPVQTSQSTIESGETPIVLDWDYLNAAAADALKAKGRTFKVVVPTDAQVAGYYAQAVNKTAPHPAAARLWMEYLYSSEGQNLWLKGYARPAEMTAMEKKGTINKQYAAKLPPVSGTPKFPTQAQATKATATVTQKWSSTVK
jgi:putative spermidine/putrescine transport system substrate-binding protein